MKQQMVYKYWGDRKARKRWGFWTRTKGGGGHKGWSTTQQEEWWEKEQLNLTETETKTERKIVSAPHPQLQLQLPQTFLQELYSFNRAYMDYNSRPSHWMPRPSTFTRHSRPDLTAAVNRLGGSTTIVKALGLVPFDTWAYFERFRDLCERLRGYVRRYGEGEYMPGLKELEESGYGDLCLAVRKFGGRRVVGERLGLRLRSNHLDEDDDDDDDCNNGYGKFSLNFACDLLEFVMATNRREAPESFLECGGGEECREGEIRMPTREELARFGGGKGPILHELVVEYGGYEAVARRLQLGF